MRIKSVPVRQTVQARFADGSAYEGPLEATLEEFILAAAPPTRGRIVAALLNGQLRELSYPLQSDALVVPVTMTDSDGVRIYRRSLSFLMIAAAADCFPDHPITIEHSMPFGGYYCECNDNYIFSDDELAELESQMRDLVAADLPITPVKVPLEEALQLFHQNGDFEKADLFAKRRKDYLTLYQLKEVRDYFHGFMVPRTGYLDLFALRRYNDGFILQFPRRHQPDQLQPFEDEPRLAKVFHDYNDWLNNIGVPSVAALNRALNSDRAQEVILVAEAFHDRQLASIAAQIASRRDKVKLVMISGPTSAGKTTFSKRLAIQLIALGISPVTIAMDNYFVDREITPRDAKGDFDFESLEAVDVLLFQTHLQALLNGHAIVQPVYNFYTGQREQGKELRLGSADVLLIEGIHGLNPRVIEYIDPAAVYRIFISAFTQLNLDQHNRVATTDTRLLRRIVRDAAHRGYTAADTLRRWPSVRNGEKKHIFPHQNNADVFFNSALVYELSALKAMAQPLLLQVEPGTPERVEANRLLAFLQWFDLIPTEAIPTDSILREFIGGSILANFEPWRQ